MAIRVHEAASLRLDGICRYTRDRRGEAQAETYITGLFAAFEGIETRSVVARPEPAEFGVEGHFFRYERHFLHWWRLSNGDVGIVTNLYERMHQMDRFRHDVG
ncbi:MAG TPA: type II toxin-antitoxin system RelE/ParE family toxin [Amaricoccus sp.]|uniref:type II toxin-antitoxin system RelE/ParE family toxin n=1 Tax=Amaricoccus sp. TaxID=1872485 RepID=UPI002C7CC806|nr:type II toxin-antitoxin system RelE/ParE family toxin [Amaricoccus sp.]HMQ92634.1 type II toxin-antitoxin system RelE/ParE family toxin [Amaricoccus sp.]HMR52882.1 type II toxin-antitoxin system RelE/ParE family toxin [Amaricoccus sp.]HMR59238.1 type II toxin-antitoxin system RelE/ParE family toxin [Amaricoccus sp.]HMT97731.1 type II toxin-antitoxin system RelE/ParE family toxin [Amaricoccus sp.]